MSVAWYCFFHHGDSTRSLSDADRRKAVDAVRSSPDLQVAYVHTPPPTPHPSAGEDVAPALALELEFANVTDCERALRQDSGLGRIADAGFAPSLAGASVSQQGMLRRRSAIYQQYPAHILVAYHYNALIQRTLFPSAQAA